MRLKQNAQLLTAFETIGTIQGSNQEVKTGGGVTQSFAQRPAPADAQLNDAAARVKARKRCRGRVLDTRFAIIQGNLWGRIVTLDEKDLEQSVDIRVNTRNVVVLWALGSAGVVEYMSDMADHRADNWQLAHRRRRFLFNLRDDLVFDRNDYWHGGRAFGCCGAGTYRRSRTA